MPVPGLDVVGVAAGPVLAATPPVRFSPAWLAIVIPVTVAAGTVICRGFTAQDRVRRLYGDDVAKARDRVKAGLVPGLVASVVVAAHPLVAWPKEGLGSLLSRGDPGDPETEVRRQLVGHAFSEPLVAIAAHHASLGAVEAAPGRLLLNARRQAAAAAVFLVSWLYMSFWASETGVALPHAATAAAAMVMAVSLGWFLAEIVAYAREANALAGLVDSVDALPKDEDG